jgi:hypothetical protein
VLSQIKIFDILKRIEAAPGVQIQTGNVTETPAGLPLPERNSDDDPEGRDDAPEKPHQAEFFDDSKMDEN